MRVSNNGQNKLMTFEELIGFSYKLSLKRKNVTPTTEKNFSCLKMFASYSRKYNTLRRISALFPFAASILLSVSCVKYTCPRLLGDSIGLGYAMAATNL